MAIGDSARAAGFDLVLPSDDRRMGYEEDNRTRDYIANERRRAVRNDSGANVIALRWEPSFGRLVPRVDATDLGHVAMTYDFNSRDALINQLGAAIQAANARIDRLEQRAAADPISPETEGNNSDGA